MISLIQQTFQAASPLCVQQQSPRRHPGADLDAIVREGSRLFQQAVRGRRFAVRARDPSSARTDSKGSRAAPRANASTKLAR